MREEKRKIEKHYKEDIDDMLETEDRLLTLDEICIVDNKLFGIYGWGGLFTEDGKFYSLQHYAIHGVLAAMLYKDIADDYGIAQPMGAVHRLPKFAYQAFLLDRDSDIPAIVLRNDRYFNFPMKEGTYSLKSLTEKQIQTIGRYLATKDLMGDLVITNYSGEISGRQMLSDLYDL